MQAKGTGTLTYIDKHECFEQSHITYEQQLRDYAIANDFSYEHCYTDDGDWQFRYWMDGWSMAGIVDVLYFEIGCFMVLNAMRGICEDRDRCWLIALDGSIKDAIIPIPCDKPSDTYVEYLNEASEAVKGILRSE